MDAASWVGEQRGASPVLGKGTYPTLPVPGLFLVKYILTPSQNALPRTITVVNLGP